MDGVFTGRVRDVQAHCSGSISCYLSPTSVLRKPFLLLEILLVKVIRDLTDGKNLSAGGKYDHRNRRG